MGIQPTLLAACLPAFSKLVKMPPRPPPKPAPKHSKPVRSVFGVSKAMSRGVAIAESAQRRRRKINTHAAAEETLHSMLNKAVSGAYSSNPAEIKTRILKMLKQYLQSLPPAQKRVFLRDLAGLASLELNARKKYKAQGNASKADVMKNEMAKKVLPEIIESAEIIEKSFMPRRR